MSARDYKFVSPGVHIEEIDNSQLPAAAQDIGPVVIGRARRGPAYRPVKLGSFSEFITMFGNPVAGQEASDVWRSGVPTAPTFAAYAAQAWLKNNNTLTFIRLLGDQSPDADPADDNATAGWKFTTPTDATEGGGAYGLFLVNSASAETDLTGVLAAVFYSTEGAPALSGSIRDVGGHNTGTKVTGSSALVCSLDTSKTFKIRMYDKSGNRANASEGNVYKETIFNFDQTSQNYIRKVFNTNPTKTNSALIDTGVDTTSKFFLGQSYDRHVKRYITDSTNCYGFIARLGKSGETMSEGGSFKFGTVPAQTGWFFSQDLRNTPADADPANNATLNPPYNPENSDTVTRLFKLHTLSTGEEEQRNFKVSIEDIRYSKNSNSPYGSFTLAIRDMKDTDGARKYVERYTNLSLDPNSANYIAKQIGDMYTEWDTTKKRLVEYGSYPNVSKIVRVEVASVVDSGQANPELLPFGVDGPVKLLDFSIVSAPDASDVTGSIPVDSNVITAGTGSTAPCFNALTGAVDSNILLGEESTVLEFTASVRFPEIPLRVSSSADGLSDPTEAYFGAQFTRDYGSLIFDESTYDVLYSLPSGVGGAAGFSPVSGDSQTSWYFSLDDLVRAGASGEAAGTPSGSVIYLSGSRAGGSSISAMTGSYKAVIDAGYDRFTSPLYGGFNGFDITEKEPFNQTRALPEAATETGYSMYYSVKKAVDMYADPEFIEGNILTAPGVVNEGLTTHMITVAEDRGDTLAIIDPRGGYTPASEDYQTEQQRITSTHVSDVVTNMETRNLNSSYAAAYYPWVRITDTVSGRGVWAPPSVAALGALAFSEKRAALWFAPAGFNRGGLSQGAAGIPVTMVRSKLTSKERDDLYDANINPIASFPNEGIVIFGQKTLQSTPSALDRINVRRLMIFVKKEISRIAAQLLFEPNVNDTWKRFTNQAEPFLNNIKNQFGLDAFRVVLDETTTTPDLIDENKIYAKIFLKPTKAVEFFAIDFVITNSGAGFED
jgi:hypothetical protein